jgi:tape measure domain-containing protein
MPFSALAAGQRLLVKLELLGVGAYKAGMTQATAATERFAAANRASALASQRATKASFLQNQTTFTLRRTLFYTTLAVGGLTAGIIKMGFEYNNALQQAKVALGPLFRDMPGVLDNTLDRLYEIATLSPFLFKDMTVAFQKMYIAFSGVGITAKDTTDLIAAMTDMLSVAGQTTPANLNRMAVALQHMAYQGRLTGYTVNQLARDGIPIFAILNKELGISSKNLHEIAAMGIPSQKVLDAIVHYARTTPGFAGAAARISNQTLSGAWAQFKDILSRASGSATGGLFTGLQETLAGVNKQLQPLFLARKPITLTNVAEAFNAQLTPASDAIINTFYLLQGVLRGVLYYFGALFWAINAILTPINKLTGLFGQNKLAIKALGIALGIAIGLSITFKAVTFGVTEAIVISRFAVNAYRRAILLLAGTEGILGLIQNWKKWAFALETAKRAGAWNRIPTPGMYKNTGWMARWSRQFLTMMSAATAAVMEFNIASLANPYVLAIVAVVALGTALTVLYFKWKPFHDLVDKTWHLMEKFPFLALLIPVIGQIVFAVVVIKDLYDWFKKLYDLLSKPLSFRIRLPFGIGGGGKKKGGLSFGNIAAAALLAPVSPLGAAAFAGKKLLGLQHGGTIVGGGSALVGEGGPEIVSLPAGASVTPLGPGSAGVARNLGLPEVLNLKTILRVDGKDLAEVVAQHRLDRQARR